MTVSLAAVADPVEGQPEDRRIGLRGARLLRDHDGVQEGVEAAEVQLVVLLASQVVGDDAEANAPGERAQEGTGARHFAPGLDVALAVGRGGPIDGRRIPGDAGSFQEPPKAFEAGFVEADLLGQDPEVQDLEHLGVAPLEIGHVEARECRVAVTDRAERRAGSVAMIEQRVVEIEEDGANHAESAAAAPWARRAGSDPHVTLTRCPQRW